MADWRLAKALETLLAEVNAKWPTRSKQSDGTIGDAAHASRSSDHNPWVRDGAMGVVTGMDITHDPGKGLDSEQLAEKLRQSQDPRIKYIISNRKIASSTESPWQWREYKGTNPHNHHVHISVKPDQPLYDSTQSWALANVAPPPPGHVPGNTKPTIRRGSTGDAVKRLQELLGLTPVDGRFDEKVDTAVKAAQERAGILADGVVAPQTWELLEKGP